MGKGEDAAALDVWESFNFVGCDDSKAMQARLKDPHYNTEEEESRCFGTCED